MKALRAIAIILALFLVLDGTTNANAQIPVDARPSYYDTVIELSGTEYVIVEIDSPSKRYGSSERLLFINTRTGGSSWAEFPNHFFGLRVEMVITENLKAVLVCARIFGLSCNHNQLFLLSPDGRHRAKVTDDDFTPETWSVNHTTGNVVVTGFYDEDGDCRKGPRERREIIVFDLSEGRVLSRH